MQRHLRTSTVAVAIAVAVAVVGCTSTPRTRNTPTTATFDSLLAAHAAHFIAKDIDAIANAYTEDAVVRSNHMDPIRGRAALRAFAQQLLAGVEIKALTYRTEKIAVYGDSAWQISTYDLTAQAAGSNPQTERGSAIDLWVRDSLGVWRIQDNVINSSLPLPAPAARQ